MLPRLALNSWTQAILPQSDRQLGLEAAATTSLIGLFGRAILLVCGGISLGFSFVISLVITPGVHEV